MADRTITIDILAKDYATAVFRNVGHGVSSFASTTYSGIEKANNALRRYNNSMRGLNSVVTSALKTAGKAVYNFTTDSIKQFAELERQHAKTMGVLSASYDFNWNGNNTAEQLKNMEQFYRDSAALKEQAYVMGSVGPTGKGSLYNPQEISAAQLSLARAGITSDQMLNTDIVETVIKFAGGNDISVDSAVAFGVQLGAQFDKKPEEWGEMFDQVTNAANMAPIDVNDVMASLKYVGNMASGYDVPLSDVLSAIVIMGQSGLKGSQAGSGISAIFSRGMNPTGITTASKAPTANVEQVYNSFKDKVIDENGQFIGLEGFTDELQAVMGDLTDVELAWFNKKMFGMYQQKAALALGRTSEDADKTFGDVANAIAENSEGVNDALYDLILESSGGQIEALSNVWDTTKMRFGDAISPLTKEVTKQLIKGLTTNNLQLDADGLQAALDEAVENVNSQFGTQISGWVERIGQLGIDGSQVVGAQAPLLEGTFDFITKFASGDFLGAIESFEEGIRRTDEEIEKLPEPLQGTATGLKNIIVMIERLYALNIVTKVAELLTSLGLLVGGVGGFIFKLVRGNTNISANSTVNSANAVVNGANVSVNASYAGINAGQIGNATFGMIQSVASFMATTQSMTVTATSVIVNGGSVTGGGSNPKGPTLVDTNGNPLTSFGNGMAQGAGFSIGAGGTAAGGLLLGGAAYNMLTGGAGTAGALGAGSAAAPLALPAASGAAEVAGCAAGATAAGLSPLATLGTMALGGLVIGELIYFSDENKFTSDWKKAYDEGVAAGLTGNDLYNYLNENGTTNRTRPYSNNPDEPIADKQYGGKSYNELMQEWFNSQNNTIAFAGSSEGMDVLYQAMADQIASGGKITEEFLNELFTKHGIFNVETPGQSTNSQIEGRQAVIEAMLNNMFAGKYSRPMTYVGEFADESIDKFVRSNIDNTKDWSGYGTIAQMLNQIAGRYDNLENVSGSVYRDTTTGQQYQLTDDGALVALNGTTANMQVSAEELGKAAQQMDTSARELARQMIASGSVNVLGLNQGPLSEQGAVDYLVSQMTGNVGGKQDFGIKNPLGMMSGQSIMNRFTSSMTGNTESGSGVAQTNALLSNIDSELDQIVAQAAGNITDEGMRAAFLEGFSNYNSAVTGDIANLQTSIVSLHDAVSTLSKNPGWVMGLGQGPLSSDGAYSYVMEQLASGTAANQQLLQNIQSGISALDPSLTVDITNRAPIVNTTVNVKVDSQGKVTKQVLNGFGAIDNWLYKSSQRFGTTTRIER